MNRPPPSPQLTGWRTEAACLDADPDLFFPDKNDNASHVDAAKAVCATCPVVADCLEFALVNDERCGVWGGMSERERRALRGAAPPRRQRVSTVQCGTTGGYKAHLRRDEPTCFACKAANAEYQRTRPERSDQTRRTA